MSGADDEGDDPGADGILGVDELHIVSTEFRSMLSQTAAALRITPMVVEYVGEVESGPQTLFSFEPNAEELFGSLLPRYVATRVYAALLEAAASESASRRRAMKSATDNADDLIKALTLAANRERQAQITQEIQRNRQRRQCAGRRPIGPRRKLESEENDCYRRRPQAGCPHHGPRGGRRVPAWFGAGTVQHCTPTSLSARSPRL